MNGFRKLRFGSVLIGCLAYILCLTQPASAQNTGLYPGQSPAKGYVQFQNGAYGTVLQRSGNVLSVEFFDGSQKRTTSYVRGTLGDAGKLSATRYSFWSSWARTASVLVRAPFLFFFYPETMANGTAGEYDLCQEEVRFGSRWLNIPCVTSLCYISAPSNCQARLELWRDTAPQFEPFTYSASLVIERFNISHLDDYPEFSEPRRDVLSIAWDYFNNNNDSSRPSWPQKIDLETDLPDTISPSQLESLKSASSGIDAWEAPDIKYFPTSTGPKLTPESGSPNSTSEPAWPVVPALWEPFPLPEGTESLPASSMNPNGYPANGNGVIVAPVPIPSVTPWPLPVDQTPLPVDPNDPESPVYVPPANPFPSDFPSPPDPTVAPSPDRPSNVPGSIGSEPITAPVPQSYPSVQTDPETGVETLPDGTPVSTTLPDEPVGVRSIFIEALSFGSGWLPSDCPEPTLVEPGLGISFEIPYDGICKIGEGISFIFVSLSLLVFGLFAFRSY